MLCPNCQFENFDSSRSCASCGKPFRLARYGSSGVSQAPPKKKTAKVKSQGAKQKSTPIKAQPKPKTAAKASISQSIEKTRCPSTKKAQKTVSEPIHKPTLDPPVERPAFVPVPVHSEEAVSKSVTLKVRSKRKISPFRLLLLVSLAVMGVLATLMIFRPPELEQPIPVAIAPGEAKVAVLCFRNDTGISDLDIWEKGLAQALTLDLMQSKSIKVMSAERIFRDMNKLGLWERRRKKYAQSDLKRIAALSGCNAFVMGSFSRFDTGYKVQAVLKEATGNSLFSDSIECGGEDELFSHVGDLTDKIRANLAARADTSAAEEDRDILDITTSSSEAFKQYVLGRWHFWQGKPLESIEAFESALKIDPDFVLVQMERASVFTALGYHDRARKQLQAAQRLIDHVSERERYHLQGEFYRLSEKTYDIALKVYTRLLELYPDDPRGNANLGILYTQLGELEKAAQCFQVNIRNKVGSPSTYLGYALNFTKQGLFTEAENILSGYITRYSDNADVRLYLAWLQMLQRNYYGALAEIKKGTTLNPSYRLNLLKGDLQMLRGDLVAAESEFSKLQKDDDLISQLWGRQRMADLFLLEGKFREAQDQLRAGLETAASQDEQGWKYRFHLDLARLFLDSGNATQALRQCSFAWEIAVLGDTSVFPREVLHLQGLAYLALNRQTELGKTVLRLQSLCEKGPSSNRMRYYYHLKGEIEMSGGDYTQAIEYFAQSFDHLPAQGKPWEHGDEHALVIDSLAEALYAAGKPIKALEKLEELRALSVGRLAYGDLYARSYYKLGKIREENGLSDIAIEFYHRFLALWEGADPGIPEISDARQRVAAAQGR